MTLSLANFKVILNLHILLGGISVDSCQPLEPASDGWSQDQKCKPTVKIIFCNISQKIYNQRPRITYLAIKI